MNQPRPRSRRAVRPAGTVGTDDAVLVSSHPAAPAPDRPEPVSAAPSPVREPAIDLRSADDTDLGWGEAGGGNDDRLQRDKPPHW
ncbi:hypothetical protein [Cellulomonas edaphi]|uniref:Uncharacterized protein n=1 Tax=Cellulomonas edaphi TaxID=3053468 RepID=A0ABT7S4T7_9CELL|nr:hypothetical protein [Cellulomons edaphi]MDM7830636.1 hypothetical protein [Cellulomons edaphi]